ncbi:MAG: SDR family oxidoreductase [Stellaceae bacterium]|jgi:3-oxoacyl-[acyl-carrier protein] reductase
MDLKDKTIVVTGAARGLGQKMAEVVARHGANLALVDLNEAELQETTRLCADAGGKANGYAANVAEEAAVENLFVNVRKDFGSVDGLINNAGTNRDALLVKVKDGKVQGKMSLADFNTVIAVDLVGVFLCGREAAVHMIEGGRGGVIINISSISRAGNIGQTNYSAAKAGVAAMTVTWAKELSRYKIRVAGIAPGFCDTRMVAKIKPAIRDRIVSMIPLKRLGQPEEIARTALFILQNDFYDGRVLEIDGGLRL